MYVRTYRQMGGAVPSSKVFPLGSHGWETPEFLHLLKQSGLDEDMENTKVFHYIKCLCATLDGGKPFCNMRGFL